MTLTELKKALGESLKAAQAIAAAAESEDRMLSGEEQTKIKEHIEKAKSYKDEIRKAEGDDDLRKQIRALGDGIDLVPNGEGHDNGLMIPGRAGKGVSTGDRFTDSPEFKSWMKQFPNGISDSTKGLTSPPVQFAGLRDFGQKALVTGVSATSAGALVFPENLGLRDMGTFMRPLKIRDLITTGQTTTETVSYVRVSGFTNSAAMTAEATASTGTSGTKPESAMTLERVDTSVKTLAHWIPATKRALSDAAQIRTLIDTFLMYGLEEKLENEMIYGDGTGEHFEGFANIVGTQTQAFDTNIFVTSRKAQRLVRTVGKAIPSAFVFAPEDNEVIDLTRTNVGGANTGEFLFGSPAGVMPQTLWGIPRIESQAITPGHAWVADFRTLVLWDREQASIQVSDSHADFFVRNMIAILAELRAAFGAFRPKAIVEFATA